MDEIKENTPTEGTPDRPAAEQTTASLPTRQLAAVIIVSLIAGALGGVYGALGLSSNPAVQKLFSHSGSPSSLNQNLVVDEQSATTQVVKDASPAVVSIVIKKDLSKMPQYNFFGFGFMQQQSN